MARTIAEIQQGIINAIRADENLSELNSTSKTALWRLFTYVVAACGWTLEKLFDTYKAEVNETIAQKKPHTLRKYAEQAKAFQLGFDLLPDSEYFNNAGATDEQIEESKVVKYAACVPQLRQNQRKYLRIKIAGETGDDLTELSEDIKQKVDEYFSRVADAGVDYEITNRPADKIFQQWTIYYNPLLYDDKGQRPDGSKPIETAIKQYLKQLPFNGTFVPTYHIDAVQKVEGVVIPLLNKCDVQYGDLPVQTVTDAYIPDAGYLRFYEEADLKIIYIPHSPIQ